MTAKRDAVARSASEEWLRCKRLARAKTDKIDGEALVRTLLAYKRGEPRVCAMVRAPTPDEEGSVLNFVCEWHSG